MSSTVAVLGSKATCLHLLQALSVAEVQVSGVVTLDDTGDSRSELDAIRASFENVSVVRKAADAYAKLAGFDPAVVLVAGWYRIIPRGVLDAFPFVGVHYSLLPRYRGSAPVVWAMINGEPTVGFSVFRLTEGMDEGPVAAQGTVPADGYIDEVLQRLDVAALPALVSTAQQILAGSARFEPQAAEAASYGAVRTPADGWIDWTRPAVELERFVRAQSRPYPGAYTQDGGSLVRVWRAETQDARYFGAPGQVVRVTEAGPVVACGGGTGLLLTQVDGVKRWSLSKRLGISSVS